MTTLDEAAAWCDIEVEDETLARGFSLGFFEPVVIWRLTEKGSQHIHDIVKVKRKGKKPAKN